MAISFNNLADYIPVRNIDSQMFLKRCFCLLATFIICDFYEDDDDGGDFDK